MSDTYDKAVKTSALSAANLIYLEQQYLRYLQNEGDDTHWQAFMDEEISLLTDDKRYLSPDEVREVFTASQDDKSPVFDGSAAAMMIDDFRRYAHYFSQCGYFNNPSINKRLDVSSYHAQEVINSYFLGKKFTSIFDLHAALTEHYMQSVGYEFFHIDDVLIRNWLQEAIESNDYTPSDNDRIKAYNELVRTEAFEQYLGRKFVGQKRFSLEGGETFIPLIERILYRSSKTGVDDVVIGMAHRGRLNVLINVMGMPSSQIEEKFHGSRSETGLSGDVKYHLGYSSDRVFDNNSMHITLGFNPSHLEVIAPVVMGSVRARMDRLKALNQTSKSMAILVHGDASIAGQGIVSESLNMSYTKANDIGGSIHVVINNQIGFTTDPKDSRSTTYCTDIAKVLQAPIFHVDADDVDAVMRVVDIACAYKNRFNKDVFIDLVCFRRHGHNESDEPSATQPIMYKKIKEHPGVASLYASKLKLEGLLDDAMIDKEKSLAKDIIKQGESLIDTVKDAESWRQRDWHGYQNEDWRSVVNSSVDKDSLCELGNALLCLPDGFTLQKQVKLMHENRLKMIAGELALNWGCAEMLAFASLLKDGYSVRLIGQDSVRGTFAHRHAIYYDQQTATAWCPLQQSINFSGSMYLYNSVLSEYSSLAYEYGYSETTPKTLVIWEAQFGDFANNAQVVIDQFLASAWQKWQRMSGLVMLLPHGYEGQGPEHSSARLERFLQLCAQENMQVCVPTTPSQCFHLLRRQLLRPYRRPLVVMSPKSLLRHPKAVSSLASLADGTFEVILPDTSGTTIDQCDRLILCAGKVYYELEALRQSEHLTNVHIARLEQIYPFPYNELTEFLQQYSHINKIIWCQEEPQNQGSWYTILHRLQRCLVDHQRVCYAGRDKMAAPASGDFGQFKQAQQLLLEQALSLSPNPEEE